MRSQKEAVYAAVMSIFEDQGVEFTEGQVVENVFTSEMRETLTETIKQGFKTKQIEFEDTPSNQAKLADDAKLSSYVSGLISNWFRKDKRLNGGVQYVAKNPGSRTGSNDPQLQALKALFRKVAGTPDAMRVQEAIDRRIAELKPKHAPVEINIDALPEELRDLA